MTSTLTLSDVLLAQIQQDGAAAYPEEGAGFLLGHDDAAGRSVAAILPIENMRKDGARHNRYLIQPIDMLRAEDEAERRGLTLLGVYHSHPDHPARPSDFDREWAQPWFSYVITSVQNGEPDETTSWRLRDDRSAFDPETIQHQEVSPS